MSLQEVPIPVLSAILDRLDSHSKAVCTAVCREWRFVLRSTPGAWEDVEFHGARGQHKLDHEDVIGLLKRSGGRARRLVFRAGKEDDTLPYPLPRMTEGARAISLAACCPNLQHLELDERCSAIGGFTDAFARAVGTHCPRLTTLIIGFQLYSLPSEDFTDTGLLTIARSCSQLRRLSLKGCTCLTDRGLFHLAYHAKDRLEDIELCGYSESITDAGLGVLFKTCPNLRHVHLDGKLVKVTDRALRALSEVCTHVETLRLTASITDSGLACLAAAECTRTSLREVDLTACTAVSRAAVNSLLAACGHVEKCTLPAAWRSGSPRHPAASAKVESHPLVEGHAW